MYIIAIPSYQRYELLKNKTLNTLSKYKIPRNRIYIFVANKNEEAEYKKILDPATYGHLIIGQKGLKNQRHFITQYFKEGTEILNLDDDLDGINILKSHSDKFDKRNNYLEELDNLDSFIKLAFKEIKRHNIFLWGIYPINNPYFMTPLISKDLRLIVGTCWGVINRYDSDLILTIDEKEDVERTLQHYVKDKAVMRFNNISVKTTYYKTPGGMQALGRDRKKDSLQSAIYLNKKYPTLTKLDFSKKSGITEVRLKDNSHKL
jgi:hypothetical protein